MIDFEKERSIYEEWVDDDNFTKGEEEYEEYLTQQEKTSYPYDQGFCYNAVTFFAGRRSMEAEMKPLPSEIKIWWSEKYALYLAKSSEYESVCCHGYTPKEALDELISLITTLRDKKNGK